MRTFIVHTADGQRYAIRAMSGHHAAATIRRLTGKEAHCYTTVR